MEEILSSIKRIIAEDSEAVLSAPRTKRSVGLSPMTSAVAPSPETDELDVLELTDPVAIEPAPVTHAPVTPAPVTPQAEVPSMPKPAIVAERPAAPPPEPAKPQLVSPTTAEASRSSLAALSALIVKPDVTGADTLEGLVREMLRPMLADWLDARLPDIVDRMVAQEIRRITARD